MLSRIPSTVAGRIGLASVLKSPRPVVFSRFLRKPSPTACALPCRFLSWSASTSRASVASSPLTSQVSEEAVRIDHNLTRAISFFGPLWLRDACQCTQCVSPSSGQKAFATTDIPNNIAIAEWHATETQLHIRWTNDVPGAQARGHESVIPLSLLEASTPKPADYGIAAFQRQNIVPRKLWNAETIAGSVRRIPYDEWMAEGDTSWLWRGILDLQHLGLLFITNVPKDEESVARIAGRISRLFETFYGLTWDVVAKPAAENVAYTNTYLGLHQDMLYLRHPPRIQLLHCLENSCRGGESLFGDGLRAAYEVMHRGISQPAEREALLSLLVPWQYDRNGNDYAQARPMVCYENTGDNTPLLSRRLERVHWSPPFQGRFQLDGYGLEALASWHAGARLFQSALEHPNSVFEQRLQEGECVIFDNMRTLHGRRAFDIGTGTRWLKGTYIHQHDFQARLVDAPAEIVREFPRLESRDAEASRESSQAMELSPKNP